MVEDLKFLSELFEKKGYPTDALELRQQAQRSHERGTPEHLKDITIYDRSLPETRINRHLKFVHDCGLSTVDISGEKKGLMPTDNKLLTVFEETPNVPLYNNELLERVFSEGSKIGSLRKSVHSLRKELELDPKNPEIFITKRGEGYLFRDPSKDIPLGSDQKAEVEERVFEHSGFIFYPDSRKIIVNGEEKSLGPKERKYLEA